MNTRLRAYKPSMDHSRMERFGDEVEEGPREPPPEQPQWGYPNEVQREPPMNPRQDGYSQPHQPVMPVRPPPAPNPQPPRFDYGPMMGRGLEGSSFPVHGTNQAQNNTFSIPPPQPQPAPREEINAE